jgi:hypothetical protein
MKEQDLVRQIRTYVEVLEKQGKTYILRNNTIRQQVRRPNGSVGFIVNGKAGSPDLVMVHKGQFIGVECKVGYNKQSEKQKEAQASIERAGGEYWLVYSFDQFMERFRKHQGLAHATQAALF